MIRENKEVFQNRIKVLIESYIEGKKEKNTINQIKEDIKNSIRTKVLERNDIYFLLIGMDLDIRSNKLFLNIPVEIKLDRFDAITQQLGFI